MSSGDVFEYRLRLRDDTERRFQVDVNRSSATPETAPDWARLTYHQCPTCPLREETSPFCPAAVDVAPILEALKDAVSFERVEVKVVSSNRTVEQNVDMQTAIRSLLGLVMSSSACPLLRRLRPMAVHHLPFATREETTFRAVSSYLLGQYFVAQAGGKPDLRLDGLRAQYEELQELNQSFSERIRGAANKDASLNAVIIFFSMSVLLSETLEEELIPVQALFER